MKNYKWRKQICFLGISTFCCLIVYSCLKDETPLNNNSTETVVLDDNQQLTISEAKTWYDANYSSITTIQLSNYPDEILIKPKWTEAKESRKGDYEIVETTLLSKKSVVFMDLETQEKFNPNKNAKKIRNIARLVIRKNLKNNKTDGFIMNIRGSYDYLMKTKRLGKNTFLQCEENFDGDIYFYNIGKEFRNGYRYKNGKITSTISPVIDENIEANITTRNTGEDCHYEKVLVHIGEKCEDFVWGDEELGQSFPICEPTYSYEYMWVCNDTVPPTILDPDPNLDPSNPQPPSSTTHPACKKADIMDSDNIFRTRVYDLFHKIYDYTLNPTYSWTEDGWIKDTNENIISPQTRNSNNVIYSSNQLNNRLLTECYHTQLSPCLCSLTYEELEELSTLYLNKKIDIDNFTYGIISSNGCFSFMITHQSNFHEFAQKIKSKKLYEYSDFELMVTKCPDEAVLGYFIKFLRDTNSGLSILYAKRQNESLGAFKLITNDGNKVITARCQYIGTVDY